MISSHHKNENLSAKSLNNHWRDFQISVVEHIPKMRYTLHNIFWGAGEQVTNATMETKSQVGIGNVGHVGCL